MIQELNLSSRPPLVIYLSIFKRNCNILWKEIKSEETTRVGEYIYNDEHESIIAKIKYKKERVCER